MVFYTLILIFNCIIPFVGLGGVPECLEVHTNKFQQLFLSFKKYFSKRLHCNFYIYSVFVTNSVFDLK